MDCFVFYLEWRGCLSVGYSFIKKNSSMLDALMSVSGAAGNRTPVQTRKPYAFYMFSPDLIFE